VADPLTTEDLPTLVTALMERVRNEIGVTLSPGTLVALGSDANVQVHIDGDPPELVHVMPCFVSGVTPGQRVMILWDRPHGAYVIAAIVRIRPIFEACFSAVGILTDQYSPPITTPFDGELFELVVTILGPSDETFRLRIYRDDVEVVDETIPAFTKLHKITLVDPVDVSIADTTLWHLFISDCSVATSDVNVAMRWVGFA
jgi:hypothetical protein